MAEISDSYLAKVRFAVRRNPSAQVDDELKDIIEQCREDLVKIGVERHIAEDENNKLVLGCQRAFARWHFGINGDEAIRNRDDYHLLADELRKNCSVEDEVV